MAQTPWATAPAIPSPICQLPGLESPTAWSFVPVPSFFVAVGEDAGATDPTRCRGGVGWLGGPGEWLVSRTGRAPGYRTTARFSRGCVTFPDGLWHAAAFG